MLPDSFDPYYQWLGIPPSDQPPHHYRLLGLSLFEDNPEVIDRAADSRIGFLQTRQNGPNGRWSPVLIGELTSARRCLLDLTDKQRYDAELQEKLSQEAQRNSGVVGGAQKPLDRSPLEPVTLNTQPAGDNQSTLLMTSAIVTGTVGLTAVVAICIVYFFSPNPEPSAQLTSNNRSAMSSNRVLTSETNELSDSTTAVPSIVSLPPEAVIGAPAASSESSAARTESPPEISSGSGTTLSNASAASRELAGVLDVTLAPSAGSLAAPEATATPAASAVVSISTSPAQSPVPAPPASASSSVASKVGVPLASTASTAPAVGTAASPVVPIGEMANRAPVSPLSSSIPSAPNFGPRGSGMPGVFPGGPGGMPFAGPYGAPPGMPPLGGQFPGMPGRPPSDPDGANAFRIPGVSEAPPPPFELLPLSDEKSPGYELHKLLSRVVEQVEKFKKLDTDAARKLAHGDLMKDLEKELKGSTYRFHFPILDVKKRSNDYSLDLGVPWEAKDVRGYRTMSRYALEGWRESRVLTIHKGDVLELIGSLAIRTQRLSGPYRIMVMSVPMPDAGATYYLHLQGYRSEIRKAAQQKD